MSHIKILDCTLRDGGYCNQWKFGYKNIKKIINGLQEAGADIIECGFLTNKVTYNKDITKYTSIQDISKFIPNGSSKPFVVMMNYGEFDPYDLPEYDSSSINGIRVAFHKKDMVNALELCNIIKNKGYKVYIQAMVTLCYSDSEFLNLIEKVNDIKPYIFYIVYLLFWGKLR